MNSASELRIIMYTERCSYFLFTNKGIVMQWMCQEEETWSKGQIWVTGRWMLSSCNTVCWCQEEGNYRMGEANTVLVNWCGSHVVLLWYPNQRESARHKSVNYARKTRVLCQQCKRARRTIWQSWLTQYDTWPLSLNECWKIYANWSRLCIASPLNHRMVYSKSNYQHSLLSLFSIQWQFD